VRYVGNVTGTVSSRIALLAPYWSFFEPNVPYDLRADRGRLAAEVAAVLHPDVCCLEFVDGELSGAAAAGRVAAAAPDSLLVVMSMCVPPAFTLAALDALPALPLVVAVVARPPARSAPLTHERIVAEGGTVGGPQLTNMLHRRGRRHELVVGRLGDPALATDLRDALATAACAPAPRERCLAPASSGPVAAGAVAVADRLRCTRIARVGRPIPGYDCVDCDGDELSAATGIELVDVEPATVRAAYLAAEPERIGELRREVLTGFQLAADVEDDDCLERSLRFAAGLAALDDRLGVDAGAMNCHVSELRFAESEPAITPCFALGRETTRGIPWSCAGDVITAVALLTVKLLGGAALYHEIEALDHTTDEALLANSGEHDLAFADPGTRPWLGRNRWWERDPRCGACACFGPRAGPGTLVAFTPHHDEPSGFRYVVAEGWFGPRSLPETGTPHAAFRFAGDAGVGAAWGSWARAGVNHHSAATPGHLADDIAAVAHELGVGCVTTSRALSG
jgi:hypothetical protein